MTNALFPFEPDWKSYNKGALVSLLTEEGEKQFTIDSVANASQVCAVLIHPADLDQIVMHPLRERPGFKHADTLQPLSEPRTVGNFIRNLRAHPKISWTEGDWFDDCKTILDNYDESRLRIFVGNNSEESLGGRYIITDGAHRLIVAMMRIEHPEDPQQPYFPTIPVFSTVIDCLASPPVTG